MTSDHPTASIPLRGRRSRLGRRTSPALLPDSPTVAEYLMGWLSGRQTLRPSTRLAYDVHHASIACGVMRRTLGTTLAAGMRNSSMRRSLRDRATAS